ncbi:unnamed protein product [Cladocopium goreaui]|uniref:Uncharacterized protein n=1 Tax=Cladocopium goreaui TaxID=2562237 RepID=A0A9P1FYS5_9DINO|nr:unnamed protein product [Cladocopium goreaui]
MTEKKESKKVAAQAFTEKLNATPASCSEADRFREADDRFKSCATDRLQALLGYEKISEVPVEVKSTLEAWCLLHGKEASIEQCLKLVREEPADFKLVGMSDLNYMAPEELDDLEKRTKDLSIVKETKEAEVAEMMLEWLQAAMSLHRWAQTTRAVAPQE